MAGDRGAHADFGGGLVAHFADQHDVRVLTQGRSQHALEREINLLVHLHLVNAGQTVFNRVFDGDDLLFRRVEFGQRGIERGCFTATRRTGHQHHAGRAADGMAHAIEDALGHADAVQPEQAGTLVEQAHDYRFAILRRHRRDTHVDGAVLDLDVEAAVLRQAFFRDVEPGHQLQAQRHGGRNLVIGLGLHVQHAVDPETDTQRFFLRFDMNVGSTSTQGFFEHGLQQLDHRRIFAARREVEQITELDRHIAHLGGELLGQTGDLLGTGIDTIDRGQQLRLGDHRLLDVTAHKTDDLVISCQIGGVSKADAQAAIDFVEHQCAEAPRLGFRQQLDQLGSGAEMFEVDEGNLQLAGQRLGNPLFRYVATIDENTPKFAPTALLLVERRLELLVGEQPLIDEKIAKANFFRAGHAKLQCFLAYCRNRLILADINQLTFPFTPLFRD